jgi:hypothetical protein
LWLAPHASAEPQRVEVVGTYPIREGTRSKVKPRDEAIQKALWEGVTRVALEMIGEEGPADELDPSAIGATAATGSDRAQPDPTDRFRKIFGGQILPYTRSFRIVEDRGERPVLFADEPGVRSEYLVVVEVIVDADRVRGELARSGLVAAAPGAGTRQTVILELVGLDRYAGFRLALDTLRRQLSAARIDTLEYSPTRQLLQLEVPYGPEEVAARLERLDSAELILEPVEIDREGRRMRVLSQWLAPAPADEVARPATAAPENSGVIRP